jgi:L-amino acid N-acyltransferase YncA
VISGAASGDNGGPESIILSGSPAGGVVLPPGYNRSIIVPEQTVHIRNAGSTDAAALAAIYNHYVLNTAISFEEAALSEAEMARRIAEVQAAGLPWLVIDDAGALAGYAYATRWRVRPAYRHSVETSVYLRAGSAGAGFGTLLYRALLARLREDGRHLVIGGIALPNPASVALHEKAGFEKVAHFSEVGFKLGRWHDVGYWQLILNTSAPAD